MAPAIKKFPTPAKLNVVNRSEETFYSKVGGWMDGWMDGIVVKLVNTYEILYHIKGEEASVR